MASSGARSPLEFLNDVFGALGLGEYCQREKIERNTNKEYLLNQFRAASKENYRKFTSKEKERFDVIYMSLGRDPQHQSLELDVKLGPENLVDIITLSKSVDNVLDGKVFLGRLLVNAFQMTAIAFVAEDPAGEQAIRVVLYNFPMHFSVFRIGTFIAIANPYFKSTFDGGLALRSDNASEVTILSEDLLKTIFPNVEWKSLSNSKSANRRSKINKPETNEEKLINFKNIGNKYFASGNYIAAIASYTEGLSLCTYDQDLLSNRAICYLKVENYKNALKDASLILENNPSHVKAIYRAAKAHIGLKQYDEAKKILEDKLKTDVDREDLVAILKKTKEYIAQRDFGQYDMAKLHVSMGKAVLHDMADYVGPVKIVDVGPKGRGLIVTEDVQPGQLLFSSKAVGIYFSEVDENHESISAIQSGFKSESALVKIIEQKIRKHPEIGKEVYSLTAGKDMGHLILERDDCTKVDTKRISAIININGWEIGLDEGHSRGLWILPSYINNDCFNCNASVTQFGDVVQVRCFKPMKSGDEVLIPYREHACPLWKRVFGFQFKDFVCSCNLCLYESQEPGCLQRDVLLGIYQDGTTRNPKKLKQLMWKLRRFSKNSPYADHYVALPQYSLASLYFDKNDVNKAIAAYQEFVREWQRYGGDITTLLYRASSRLFYLYFGKGDMINAKKWRDTLLEHVRLNFGSAENALMEAINPGILECFSQV